MKQPDGSEPQVVIFSNKNKTKDNQPDFRVYKSEPPAAAAEVSTQEVSEDQQQEEDLL